ncbi:hypothetical protein E2C01_085595 [Portunus trituberculatus]|uniref:Uncharacterized protein n=1 Tax=Portunus trituberculatus TaxID=210409 RepID=A0A5B7J1F5_PORTR|nr:hypothetical protein [Portunus trituberculatus]
MSKKSNITGKYRVVQVRERMPRYAGHAISHSLLSSLFAAQVPEDQERKGTVERICIADEAARRGRHPRETR